MTAWIPALEETIGALGESTEPIHLEATALARLKGTGRALDHCCAAICGSRRGLLRLRPGRKCALAPPYSTTTSLR